jgi:hypothetical protein
VRADDALLEGLDGVNKMSKSLGNYIGIAESPTEIFGKLMSVSDELMWRYYELLSFRGNDEIARFQARGGRGPQPARHQGAAGAGDRRPLPFAEGCRGRPGRVRGALPARRAARRHARNQRPGRQHGAGAEGRRPDAEHLGSAAHDQRRRRAHRTAKKSAMALRRWLPGIVVVCRWASENLPALPSSDAAQKNFRQAVDRAGTIRIMRPSLLLSSRSQRDL